MLDGGVACASCMSGTQERGCHECVSLLSREAYSDLVPSVRQFHSTHSDVCRYQECCSIAQELRQLHDVLGLFFAGYWTALQMLFRSRFLGMPACKHDGLLSFDSHSCTQGMREFAGTLSSIRARAAKRTIRHVGFCGTLGSSGLARSRNSCCDRNLQSAYPLGTWSTA